MLAMYDIYADDRAICMQRLSESAFDSTSKAASEVASKVASEYAESKADKTRDTDCYRCLKV